MEKAIKDAEKDAYKYLTEGYDIPGYGLQQKFGNRKWTASIEDVDALHAEFKKWIPKKGLYIKKSLPTITEFEKYFLEVPEATERLKKYVEKPDKGLCLAKVKS